MDIKESMPRSRSLEEDSISEDLMPVCRAMLSSSSPDTPQRWTSETNGSPSLGSRLWTFLSTDFCTTASAMPRGRVAGMESTVVATESFESFATKD